MSKSDLTPLDSFSTSFQSLSSLARLIQVPQVSREEVAHLQQLVRDLVQGSDPVSATVSSSSQQKISHTPHSEDVFDQTPYVIKQIFQSNQVDAFKEQLASFVTRKEQEIERVCGLHWQEFVASIDQLLKIRSGTTSMREKIEYMGSSIESVGDVGISKRTELIQYRRQLVNIEVALESLQSCLFVMDICGRISVNIASRKYFAALRMLQDLQGPHATIIHNYSFSRLISDWIPKVQKNVRVAVLKELKDWLITVKELAYKVGKLAMEMTSTRHQIVSEMVQKDPSLKKKRATIGPGMELAITEEMEIRDTKKEEDIKIDFTPLLQCVHIHEVLGKRAQLKLDFEENRKIQADQVIKATFALKDNTLSFQKYIETIAGFFVIEATLMTATQDFRSRSSVETLWDQAMMKMGAHIVQALQNCNQPELFLDMKKSIYSFVQAMEMYGFTGLHLKEIMFSLLERFSEITQNNLAESIGNIFSKGENSTAETAENKGDLQNILQIIPISEDMIKLWMANQPGGFPITFPFTKRVALIFNDLYYFIEQFYIFSGGFVQQSNEMDDMARKILQNTIIQSISGEYREMAKSAGLAQALQIMIDCDYTIIGCGELELALQEKRVSNKTARLLHDVIDHLQESRVRAESRIFEFIKTKISTFIEMVQYRWDVTVARSTYSPILNDLVGYVSSLTDSSLQQLSSQQKMRVYFEAFDFLASEFKRLITQDSLKYITIAALMTLEKDLIFLEQYVKKFESTQGEGTLNCSDSFTEIHQLVNYCKNPDGYEDLLIASIRQRKFGRVEVKDAVAVLRKLSNFDSGYFSKATQNEKNLKKQIEATLSKIK